MVIVRVRGAIEPISRRWGVKRGCFGWFGFESIASRHLNTTPVRL